MKMVSVLLFVIKLLVNLHSFFSEYIRLILETLVPVQPKGREEKCCQYQIGLGADQPPTYKSLKTLVNELGHNKRTVDIFKIDCEGCEWSTSPSLFFTESLLNHHCEEKSFHLHLIWTLGPYCYHLSFAFLYQEHHGHEEP